MARIVWTQRQDIGPSARTGTAMAFDVNRSRTVLFGGRDAAGAVADTWEWGGTHWTQVQDVGPSARDTAAMAFGSAGVLLFGGYLDSPSRSGDTWAWDGAYWTQMADTGPAPRNRAGLVFDAARAVYVLFGGASEAGEFADTWTFDGSAWTQVADTGPSSRIGHALAYDAARQQVVLFGGLTNGEADAGTWVWDGGEWTQAQDAGPSPRAGHVMVGDESSVWLFGGGSKLGAGSDGLFADSWEWNGSTWTQREDIGPSPRTQAAAAYDSARRRIVLFGGSSARRDSDDVDPVGDTWEAVVSTGVSPPAPADPMKPPAAPVEPPADPVIPPSDPVEPPAGPAEGTTTGVQNGPLGSCTVFPPDNAWNTDVSEMRVHANSANYIANILANGGGFLHVDFGIPYVTVGATQPKVPVSFIDYPDESDPGPYPIPLQAPIEDSPDARVITVDTDNCVLYELYDASRSENGWVASLGARWDLTSNALRPIGWASADMAGLPVFAGLLRYDEVASGHVGHALRVTMHATQNGFVPPATHSSVSGSTDPNRPPMGLRFRLRADFDTSAFTGQSRVIVEALKKYGLIVADTGANWFLTASVDARWSDDLQQLRTVPGSAFEVVDPRPF